MLEDGVLSTGGAASRMWRALLFARHSPVRKMSRHFVPDLKQRWKQWLPVGLDREGYLPPRSRPVEPLFAPRKGRIKRNAHKGTLTLTLVGRTLELRGPFDQPLDWSTPGPGIANQLWRSHLHAMEYLETVDDILFARLCQDWIAHNASPSGPARHDAWNSYALSIRVVVWMQQIDKRKDRLNRATVDQLGRSIAAQVRYLENNLETDIGGNHLFKNIKALLCAGVFFDGPEAQRWRRIGRCVLRQQLSTQLLDDGVHIERSPSYQCQVFADLLECRYVLQRDPLGGALDMALAEMAQAVSDLAHPDNQIAQFNDAGLTMAYSPEACLEAYQRLFGSAPSPRSVFAFEKAGYFGARLEDVYIIADCGRAAMDDLPTQAHSDALSFELSVAGNRMIVDQGVFEYGAGPRRDWSLGCDSHNTLWLEDAKQTDYFRSLRYGRQPAVRVRRWQPLGQGFVLEGSHDGFKALPGRPVHVRRFEVSPDEIIISDQLEGNSKIAAQISFLLHPDVAVEPHDCGVCLLRGRARVNIVSSAPVHLEPAIWWPDLGVKIMTCRVTFSGSTRYKTRLEFGPRRKSGRRPTD
ncbi:MAG: heparinase II/III family protein [Pseudomonadota bacterium]